MADLDWIFDVLPRSCWLQGKTSGRESGIGFRFTARSGAFLLFHTDEQAARAALDLVDGRCCDYALLWRRRRPGIHCTAIELKGGNLSRACSQAKGFIDAFRRRAGRSDLLASAIVIFRGDLDEVQKRKLMKAFSKAGIDLAVKKVKKGNADIGPLLNKLDRA